MISAFFRRLAILSVSVAVAAAMVSGQTSTTKTPAKKAPAKAAPSSTGTSSRSSACARTTGALQTIKFYKYTPANGLVVILSEDHRLPLVSTNIWYHVGPA